METLALSPATTALIVIDLQNGIVSRPLQPHAAAHVIARTAQLASILRSAGGTAVYVRVDVKNMLPRTTDEPSDINPADIPDSASELVPAAGFQNGDLFITKRSWGAFHGTTLDQQLRERNIRTVIMTGVATNFGVESTARSASDLGYDILFAEDAMSTISPEAHDFAIQKVFPRLGRVRSTADVLKALAK